MIKNNSFIREQKKILHIISEERENYSFTNSKKYK